MVQALYIALMGMIIVFASLGILLLVMWLIGRLLRDKPQTGGSEARRT